MEENKENVYTEKVGRQNTSPTRKNGSKHIPASYDPFNDIYYIAMSSGQKYRKIIEDGNYDIVQSFIENPEGQMKDS